MVAIDVDKLRGDLINYFGTAAQYNPTAMMDLIEVQNCSDERVVEIAEENGFDLNRYVISY